MRPGREGPGGREAGREGGAAGEEGPGRREGRWRSVRARGPLSKAGRGRWNGRGGGVWFGRRFRGAYMPFGRACVTLASTDFSVPLTLPSPSLNKLLLTPLQPKDPWVIDAVWCGSCLYLDIVKRPGQQQHTPGTDPDRFTYYGWVRGGCGGPGGGRYFMSK